jgi:hypothetical protein
MTQAEREFIDLLDLAIEQAKQLNEIVDRWSEALRKRHEAKDAQ